MSEQAQTFEFQAETQQLLNLMIHSLYTNKEIFLRELVSNASDALDRLRFEALTRPELIGDDELEIRLEPDADARTLTIHDNGIGMNRDEVIANIGTIAKSGTRELMEKVRAGESEAQLAELIGQFGVGFYSSFMVADRVVLVTRRAGESGATRWESSGDGRYDLAEASRDSHGTSITLHLKAADGEDGIDDFTQEWPLRQVVKRYSDFVTYPVRLKVEREKPKLDDEGNPVEGGDTESVVEDLTLNSMKPIWTRSESEVEGDELKEFYRHISHDWNDPMQPIWLKAEGRFEYQALLFIPGSAPYDLYYMAFKAGLQLYVRRVLIMEHCEDLLPRYLRFLKGVVEASDLPLNVSRELLQQNRQMAAIRKGLVRKVLDTLRKMKQDEGERYLEFWGEFGRALKEGVGEEQDYRDRVIELLLFESSHGEELTSLADYVGRMGEDQNEIYYLTGESREAVAASPHLEAFRDKEIEVLYLVDPVDELMVQSLHEYEGKALKSVGKGTVDLTAEEDKEAKKKEMEELEESFSPLLEALQKSLDETVKQVRLSGRLTTSPACLVGAEHDYSPQLEKLLQKGKGGGAKQRRILELNPEHDIVRSLLDRHQADAEDGAVGDYAELLLGYATLAEGSELTNPVRFNSLVVELLSRGLAAEGG
ncbi:MAG: molecular chaperone HtpG [Acidobacteriota bacterium]